MGAAATTITVVLLSFERKVVLEGDLQRIVIALVVAAATALVVWVVTRVSGVVDPAAED